MTPDQLKELGQRAVKSPHWQWISVDDRLPEEGVTVLTHHPGYTDCYMGYQEHNHWEFDGGLVPDPSHWMPLPEPPK